jgi:hypothetical protein
MRGFEGVLGGVFIGVRRPNARRHPIRGDPPWRRDDSNSRYTASTEAAPPGRAMER